MNATLVKGRIESVLSTLSSMWIKIDLGESDAIFTDEIGKIKEVSMVLMGLGLTSDNDINADIIGVDGIVMACEKYATFLDEQI